MTKLVRIGKGYPSILPGEDRWGCPQPYLVTNNYGYIPEDFWQAIQCYQTPMEPTPHEKEELSQLATQGGTDVDQLVDHLLKTAYAKRFERVMKLPGNATTVWEFNAYASEDRDSEERVRMTAAFGVRGLVEWNDDMLTLHRQNERTVKEFNELLEKK